MQKALHVGDDVSLPVDAVTGTFCVVGIRGSGKSNTGVVFAEEMLKVKQQIIALDPKDDWWGIRSAADGVSAGYPVTILGGTHQDAPLEHTAGALVAQLAIEERISLILSTKHFSDGQRFRFTYDFCDYLYKHCREPAHLYLDEADQFAPQEKNVRTEKGFNVSEAMMLNLVRRVIKQGRTSGLGITLITQSPATLDKRAMNMCETLIAMRVVGAQDFDAVERWFKVYLRKKEDLESIVSQLPTLEAGRGVFYSPFWLKESRVVRFRMAETFDSRKTPKVGERRVEPKVLAPVDLEHLSERMRATIERTRAEDPRELKRQIHELKRQLATQPPVAPSEQEIEAAVRSATYQLEKEWQTAFKTRDDTIEDLLGRLRLLNVIQQTTETVAAQLKGIADLDMIPNGKPLPHFDPAVHVIKREHHPTRPVAASRVAFSDSSSAAVGAEGLTNTQRQILDTILMLNLRSLPATRDSVARWMNKHPSGGRYGSDLACLRSQGYIDGFTLTDKGTKTARSSETGTAAARSALKDDSQRRIFDVLLGGGSMVSRKQFTRDTLAETLGLHPSGGRYGSNLAWLRTMGLIPDRGAIFLTDGAYA